MQRDSVTTPTPVAVSHFGRALKVLEAGGIRMCESVYSPDQHIPAQLRPWAGFSLTLDGAYEEAYGSTRQHCGPASLVFHPPEETYSDRILSTGSRCLTVAVDPALLQTAVEALPALDRLRYTLRAAPTWLVFDLRAAFALHDDLSAASVESSVLVLLAELAERPGLTLRGSPPPWLQSVRERIHDEFTLTHSLYALAQTAGVHRVHLARAFRQHYGCTVGDYTRLRRVEFACHQLVSSGQPLSDIALSAGFGDQSHLTNVFRRLVGVPPGVFRQRFGRPPARRTLIRHK